MGTGAFGVVSLVRERETGALYAMKEVGCGGKSFEEKLMSLVFRQLRKSE